ncbi:kinase-like domain-containing protein [Aspergillus avenaceus]|uniref:cyclin-dependent kinase n=1 Tax=Aspergillus avenaceus TaxID=36643 RepID=A0A5N6TUY8_ASPAV|nr:kinase-like domain-containing protein [Aspergillus avenaceus]
MREAAPVHGMRASDARDSKRINTRFPGSPHYVTPSNSYHGSPQPTSPYSGARGGWNGHSPPQRPPPTGPQSQFHQGHIPTGPSYRGGHSGYRGGYNNQGNDRRFSGPGSQGYSNAPSPRGRGNFNNFQWSGPRGRGPHSPHTAHGPSSQSPVPAPMSEEQVSMATDRGDNTSRPSGQNRPIESENTGSDNGDPRQLPPNVPGQPGSSATPNKGGKISFAFKAKTASAPAPKPVPDLAERMLAREPPPRAAEPPRNKLPTGPPPRFKPEPRFDRRDRDRDRDRDRHRDRDRDRGRNDRRDFREPRGPREPRDRRDTRRDGPRFDHRAERRRGDRRHDFRPERRRERSLEPKKQPKVLTRPKPRPTLPAEFVNSDSVYYRKPGNESVIGAGTYGKVFKAIHVYTQNKVALKKIRMEGEKDGFPVTAVREIKLLQHLRNHNVVSLLEVMVEKNECFMVFEYLSHDLTGLINHPTFTLTAAHKKDLAKQMFEGLSYLHHRGVLHRDIKAANILISNRGQLKYADFGLARFFSKSRQLDYTNRVITIWYRPPELLLGETRYGPAVDVWSAACVYVEMFTKKAVFPGEGGEISQLEKLYNCLGTPTRADWPDIIEMPWFELMRPTERKKRVFEEVYGRVLTPAALDLVSHIFRYDPTKRPTAEEVLAHPYFASEEPKPQQAVELENIEGDWHEFESKALRKEKDREARRAEYQRDKEKRKAGNSAPPSERENKRARPDFEDSQPSAQRTDQ